MEYYFLWMLLEFWKIKFDYWIWLRLLRVYILNLIPFPGNVPNRSFRREMNIPGETRRGRRKGNDWKTIHGKLAYLHTNWKKLHLLHFPLANVSYRSYAGSTRVRNTYNIKLAGAPQSGLERSKVGLAKIARCNSGTGMHKITQLVRHAVLARPRARNKYAALSRGFTGELTLLPDYHIS